jgi:hypothetical protein
MERRAKLEEFIRTLHRFGIDLNMLLTPPSPEMMSGQLRLHPLPAPSQHTSGGRIFKPKDASKQKPKRSNPPGYKTMSGYKA